MTRALRLIDRAGINDKVEHSTAYAILAALATLDRFRCPRLRSTIASLFLLGALRELAQLFSPGRTCDWRASSPTPAASSPVWSWSVYRRSPSVCTSGPRHPLINSRHRQAASPELIAVTPLPAPPLRAVGEFWPRIHPKLRRNRPGASGDHESTRSAHADAEPVRV